MIKLNSSEMQFILALIVTLGFLVWMAHDFYKYAHRMPPIKIEIAYDCRLAEISPDYPQIVKDKCRKLMTPRVSGVK